MLFDHLIDRLENGEHGALATRLTGAPGGQHLVPQQRRKQETGRDRLVIAHALVGALQGKHDEPLAQRLLENDVEHRQQTMMQA